MLYDTIQGDSISTGEAAKDAVCGELMRRMVRIQLDATQLVRLLWGSVGDRYFALRRALHAESGTAFAIPADVIAARVYYSPVNDAFVFFLIHSSFPVVPPGGEVPLLMLEYEERPAADHPQAALLKVIERLDAKAALLEAREEFERQFGKTPDPSRAATYLGRPVTLRPGWMEERVPGVPPLAAATPPPPPEAAGPDDPEMPRPILR